ncbi:hypothetical protein MBLNU459_g6654t1 [Dothideomycetes sp. NU459]
MTSEASKPLMSDKSSSSDDISRESHDDVEKLGNRAHQYHDRSCEESVIDPSQFRTPTLLAVFFRRTRLYILIAAILLLALVLFLLVFARQTVINPTHNNHHHHHDAKESQILSGSTIRGTTCGASNAEGLALNCTFDPITYAWMPPLCYHADLAADALSPTSRFAAHNKAGIFA